MLSSMALGLRLRDIRDVAADIGLGEDLIEVHGPYRAKGQAFRP